MEIYLVRHTETVCEKGICYGQADVGIRAPYEAVFEEIKYQIPASTAVFYSSPLQRCALLAAYLSGNDYAVDARLMELNFGDWELRAWSAIPKAILNPWMENFVTNGVPNGESFMELNERVWNFFEELKMKNHQRPVVLVTHSGVIRSVLCKINAIPLQDAFVQPLDYGVVVRVEL